MAEPLRLEQIVPLGGRRQLVGLEVTRVVHDAVARERLALVEALRVVDGVAADLGRDLGVVALGRGRQQLVAFEDLEGIGRARPHHVRTLARGQFADVGDRGHRVLVEDLELDAGVGLLEGGLVSGGQFLGEGGDHGDRAGQGGAGSQHCRCSERGEDELLHGISWTRGLIAACGDTSKQNPLGSPGKHRQRDQPLRRVIRQMHQRRRGRKRPGETVECE